MGRAVSHVGAPWKRAQKMVEAGRADAFVTVPTDVRLAYTDSSRNVVFTFEQRAFVKKGGAAEMALMEDPSLASIAKLRVCDILGNGWAIRFYAQHGIEFHAGKRLESCMKQIAGNRMDVIIHSTTAGMSEVNILGLEGAISMLPTVYNGMSFTLMISKKSDIDDGFLDEFDSMIDGLKDDAVFDSIIEEVRGY